MIDNNYESSLIANFYVDENSVPYAKTITENQQVSTTKDVVQLTNIPYIMDNLKIKTSDNNVSTDLYRTYNMDEVTTNANAFYMTSDGLLYFNSTQAGKKFIFEYYGAGVVLISTNRIFYRDSENVVHILEDLISAGEKALLLLAEYGDAKTVMDALKADTANGQAIDTSLKADISTATPLDASLKSSITTGTPLDASLKSSITTGTTLKSGLDSDITTGTTLKSGLDSDITTGTTLKTDLETWANNHQDITALDARVTTNANNITTINTQLPKKQDLGNVDIRDIFSLRYGTNNKNSITVFGDSISHGAGSTTTYDDSWVGLIRKAFKEEYGGKMNYGFVSFNTHESADSWFKKDIIDKTCVGSNWNSVNCDGNYLGSYADISVTSGEYISIKLRKHFNYMKIAYEINTDCGNFSLVNDSIGTINFNCNGSQDKLHISDLININQINEYEEIKLVNNANSRIAISGIYLLDDPNYITFNNYSKSGMSAKAVTDAMATVAMNADIVFMNLGYNDCYGTKDIDTFKTRMNTYSTILNTNKAFVIVCDFLWWETSDNAYRQALKGLADSLENSVYIPFPDIVPFNKVYQTSHDIGFLFDWAHPTDKGHKFLAEYIMRAFRFSKTSKEAVNNPTKKSNLIGIRNLAKNTANVYIANSNLSTDTSVPLTFVDYIGNLLQNKFVTISAGFSILANVSDTTDYGVKILLSFADGSKMNIGVWRNLDIKETDTTFATGNFKGIVSKTFSIPDKTISSVTGGLFVKNLAGASVFYENEIMLTVGDSTVGWIPAREDA